MTPDKARTYLQQQLKHIAFSRGEDFASEEEHLKWTNSLLDSVPNANDMIHEWVISCIGFEQAYDKEERIFRFFEEACELAQACGMTKKEAKQLIKYVWNRPVGEIRQEVGGVWTTLHALCNAHRIVTFDAGIIELQRAWDNIDKIRRKHLSKPRRSPLPGQENQQLGWWWTHRLKGWVNKL